MWDFLLMEISLKTLGSYELQEQVFKDLESLLKNCKYQSLIPLYLTVGKVFIEVGTAHSIITELQIDNWPSQISSNLHILSIMVQQKLLEVYDVCDKNNCIFDKSDNIIIYFDPEDPYMTLYVANPHRKATQGEPVTGKGLPVERLKYEDTDILPEFDGLKINH